MLTSEQTRRLTAIQRRHTLYEVILWCTPPADVDPPPVSKYLVGYCHRTHISMRRMITKHATRVLLVTGCDDNVRMHRTALNDLLIGKWTAAFSGRTERNAILEGELPWIGDAPESPVDKATPAST